MKATETFLGGQLCFALRLTVFSKTLAFSHREEVKCELCSTTNLSSLLSMGFLPDEYVRLIPHNNVLGQCWVTIFVPSVD